MDVLGVAEAVDIMGLWVLVMLTTVLMYLWQWEHLVKDFGVWAQAVVGQAE